MKSPLRYLGIPLRREEKESVENYLRRIKNLIEQNPDYDIYIFPEYTWGSHVLDDGKLEQLLVSWKTDAIVVLGTALIEKGNKRYNTILVYDYQKGLRRIAKKYPVLYEQEHRGVVGASEPPESYVDNVLEFRGYKIGFIACSDMWQSSFITEIAEKGADLLVVSSMTVTLPDLREYARVQWHSLAIVRSREYVMPIIIVDSMYEDKEKITGRVTCGVDPSLKNPELKTINDFLNMPDDDGLLRGTIDFDKIDTYRKYRDEQGLRYVRRNHQEKSGL